MGGAVSAGRNNDELVDNLCHENYIQTPEVERVFRQCDRASFMTLRNNDALEAYEDHAWRNGTLHLSAPCIYTRAMESLQFKQGVSFLNVGSGTGYLSTMAGLLIGPYGINHGIEIFPENVAYAQEKQVEFYDKCPFYDPLTYCEPLFVIGNGLLLNPGSMLYDRIYCGAGCSPGHAQLMKNMQSVGGILIIPQENQLESICRVSQTEWKMDVILPSVSFAPLILPSQESPKDLAALELITAQPLSLKQYCRLEILKQLTSTRYCKISELPIPQHLKDYVAHYKEWGPPSPPVKTLCPIDHSKEQKKKNPVSDEEGGEGSDGDVKGGARGRGSPRQQNHNMPYAQPMNIDGRKVLICNFNGIYIQIPMDFDDNGSGSDDDGSSGDHKDQKNKEDDSAHVLDETTSEISTDNGTPLLAEEDDGMAAQEGESGEDDNNLDELYNGTTNSDSDAHDDIMPDNNLLGDSNVEGHSNLLCLNPDT